MKKIYLFDTQLLNAKKLLEMNIFNAFSNFQIEEKILTKKEELLNVLEKNQVDVIFIFQDVVESSSFEILKIVVENFPNTRIVLFSKDISYKTVRNFFINGVYDYFKLPIDGEEVKSAWERLSEDVGMKYIVNSLKLKIDALILDIFNGGDKEEYIINDIINTIFADWKNDSLNSQIVCDKAKYYIYNILIERKSWLDKFLYKKDYEMKNKFSYKTKDEILENWVLCFEQASAIIRKYQMIDDKLVYRIGKYVVVHVDEKLSLEIVSENVFLNASYISFIFKKITGVKFNQFITDVKIDRAKVLLRDNDIKIFEVANILGFLNQEYFARVFKNKTGFTPLDYQKMLYEKHKNIID